MVAVSQVSGQPVRSLMFFYAAKIVWFLLQPSSVVMVALAAAWWAGRQGPSTRVRPLIGLALGLVLCGLSPLPNVLLLPLEQRFARADLNAAPVTGFIILGGGEDAEIALKRHAHALNEGGERISEAVALARLLPFARIVFSGGTSRVLAGTQTEATATREMLLGMGVSPERLSIEEHSRDTWENATFSKVLIAPIPDERWLLVTSAWHMPRAMGVFRQAGFAVEPWPVDYRTGGWEDAVLFAASPADGMRHHELAAKEYTGLLAYWLQGRSSSLFPGPCAGSRTC